MEACIKGGGRRQSGGTPGTTTAHHVLEKLLGLCRGPIFFDEFSLFLLDCHEHHINCYLCTKT